MKVTNKEYLLELAQLKEQMVKAEAWAEKLPIFKDYIIKHKLSADMSSKYGERYKDIPLSWGINRDFFEGIGTRSYMTNCTKPHQGFYWHIYVNGYSLFDMHGDLGLKKVAENSDIFFYDALNSKFYCTDEQIEGLLEALNAWYLIAKENVKEIRNAKRLEELEKELARLKG